MKSVSVDIKGVMPFVSKEEQELLYDKVYLAHDMLENRNGPGRNMLGWLDLPEKRDEEEIEKIKQAAARIQKQADVFIVVGIGGSYLGAKAVIDLLSSSFSNLNSLSDRKHPQIIFAGNNMSAKYMKDLIEFIKDKDVAINVISKSGTTLEPAMTLQMREYM